ncbi:MAG TPA: serine/threonine-protein kinase [Planctomycetota bacterium]|jgi:serine/threonine-protein kinase|nr:serine/threonine-protein kinase [Planctomycetota bacterium]MDP7245466.1 serine/threonine-protein kinase [Planctomycetota bacterium]HJM39234.1 serine/threonine-protein kinase [Planctomycetota bacterium]|tara:strand:- start:5100 stop:6104 length:1005 start_codon:yes stop_codon:yes gene_type:complete
MTEPSATQEDQQFLALLVHRGFFAKADAVRILQSVSDKGFTSTVLAATGWDVKKLNYLRQTKGLLEPVIPGFEDTERVGTGGTADVFRARRSKDFSTVALKVLLPRLALDPPSVKRFLEEGRMLQSLDHPAIVSGHRIFKFMDTYILEMDFVPGKTLEEILDEGEPIDEETALSVVLQAARALEYLRTQEIVHRDMKPGNLMLKPDGNIILIDLGFAGAGMEGRVSEDSTLGTPSYLAPEQALGDESLDARADIYSLGVTLYHLVMGSLPFTGESEGEVMRKQILEGLKGSAMKGRDISPRMHYIIEKMMAKDREMRYSSPAELVEDLEAMGPS